MEPADADRAATRVPATSEPYSGEPEALFGISFADAFRAEEFLLALRGMASRGDLVLSDAVVVYKGEDGNVKARETTGSATERNRRSGVRCGWA